jgi:hypothetical protein
LGEKLIKTLAVLFKGKPTFLFKGKRQRDGVSHKYIAKILKRFQFLGFEIEEIFIFENLLPPEYKCRERSDYMIDFLPTSPFKDK